MVYDTAHWEGFGSIPSQGGPQSDGGATLDRMGRGMGLSPAGGSDGRGGVAGGGYLRLPPPEHIHTVYCDQAHCVIVSGVGADSGVEVGQAVVGAGRTGFGGYAVGGSGVVMDGGGVGNGRDGDRDGLSQWEDNVAHITLGTEPNAPLAYAP